jgi:protoporphyrinogen oxidase
MTAAKDNPVVIVGAGITGLSLAAMLTIRGFRTIVVEKDDYVGGLARSFTYDGFTFDIGPHRFHSEKDEVVKFVRETLGSDYLEIDRNSQVHFAGHYYPWPLRPKELLLHFPPRIAAQVMLDLVLLYRKEDPISFRDQIENMYGSTLYKHFFEGYSSKFLGITPELTDRDWATTGVDRAIIDKRLKMNSLWQLVWNTILPGNVPEVKFIYPRGGCGVFTDLLAEYIKREGGEVLLGTEATDLEIENGTITKLSAGGQTIKPSLVVWTGTVHSMAEALDLEQPNLEYLALVCYNMCLTEGHAFDFQWCYHGDPDIFFSRVSIPDRFSPDSTPGNKRSYCVEVSCREDDDIYHEPEKYLDRILRDLKHVDLLRTDREVISVHPESFPWAYPIYKLGYRDDLARFQSQLKGYNNLYAAGRLGKFWYNNMDHCIEESLELSEKLVNRLSRPGGRA